MSCGASCNMALYDESLEQQPIKKPLINQDMSAKPGVKHQKVKFKMGK